MTADQLRLHTAAVRLLAALEHLFPKPAPVWRVVVEDAHYRESVDLMEAGQSGWGGLTGRILGPAAERVVGRVPGLSAVWTALRRCRREARHATGPGAVAYRALLADLIRSPWVRGYDDPDQPYCIDNNVYHRFDIEAAAPNLRLPYHMAEAARTLDVLPVLAPITSPQPIDLYIAENEKLERDGVTNHSQRAVEIVKDRTGVDLNTRSVRMKAWRRKKQLQPES